MVLVLIKVQKKLLVILYNLVN